MRRSWGGPTSLSKGAYLGAVCDVAAAAQFGEKSPMSTMRTASYLSPNESHKILVCANGVSPGRLPWASSSRRCRTAYSSVGRNGRRMWKEAPPSSP